MRLENNFAVRQNTDGSFDGICLNCYQTIGTARSEVDLVALQKEHRCDEANVAWLHQVRDKRRRSDSICPPISDYK